MFLSRDWKRRPLHLVGLVNHKLHQVQSHISNLALKNVRRMVTHVGQEGVPGNMRDAFKILGQQLLKSFPPPEAKNRKFPKLIVLGYTSKIGQRTSLTGITSASKYISSYSPPYVRNSRNYFLIDSVF